MANFIQVTPCMLCPGLSRQSNSSLKCLAFRSISDARVCLCQPPGGWAAHDGGGAWQPIPAGTRRFAYYFDCRDVDASYADLKPKLDALPEGDVHGPADKPYRQRKLLALAPDGNLIAFGQALATD